jgi:3-carboxy-cis,cis-muconate cycloisomerase
MTETPHLSLTTPLFSSAAMRAIFDDRARLQRMLDLLARLARAQASLGVIPAMASEIITRSCRAECFDVAALAAAAVPLGDVASAIVAALTAEVAKTDAEAARFVNWGTAPQDLIDTALVMELRDGIDALIADLDRAIKAFAALAGKHRRLPMVARTGLRHALPMPFGLKVAGYAAALARSRERLRRLRKESLLLQLGGAAGTLDMLDERGLEVAQRLAALLNLTVPDAPWHSHRDRLAEIAACFAILAGSCGKIARDVALMMQTDVAEAFEPVPEGAAATMVQRRVPLAATAAVAAATLTPNLAATIFAAQIQEHERAAGAWAAEWPTFPALALATSGALANVVHIAEGLEIDAERMRANIDTSGGLIMAEPVALALSAKLGKAQAQAVVEEACGKAVAEKRPLQEVLAADERVTAHLPTADLARLFEPMAYQGAAQTFIERQVASLQNRAPKRS